MKAGIGSAVAIFLAEMLGLSYSPSAGIITLLTIQNTRKETLKIAARRVISFLVAVIISFLLFNDLGYSPWVFGIFVLLFSGISYLFGLKDGISMNAVLMTHFLIEKRMDLPLFANEALILGIGMGIGIVINMIMPNYRNEMRFKQRMLEDEIKKILKTMAYALKAKKACLIQDNFDHVITFEGIADTNNINMKTENLVEEQLVIDFRSLDTLLDDLIQKAYEDSGNRLLSDTRYFISYLEIRKHQIDVLKVISKNISNVPVLLKQSIPMANFFEKIADSFNEMNNAEGLLKDLEILYNHYKQDKLPATREEFEYRAVLYQIFKELEYFLLIKRNFVIDIEKKNIKTYWN